MTDKLNEFEMPGNIIPDENQLGDNDSTPINETAQYPGGIQINTASVNQPTIVLIGPKSVGKTVTLIRLAKYLENGANYKVVPNKGFRSDADYDDVCDKFISAIRNTNTPPNATAGVNFLLLDVKLDGKTIFHILEAPGEHYFLETQPNRDWFHPYFMTLLNKPIQIIFTFMFEDGFLKTDGLQQAYSDRLAQIISHFNSNNKDKIIFCLNKVDKLGIMKNGQVNDSVAKDYILSNNNFQSLKNMILSNKEITNVSYVSFSSGQFAPIGNGQNSWTLSNDSFPKNIWKAINKKEPFKIFGIKIG